MASQQELAAIRHLFGDHEAQLWSEGRGHMFVRDNEGEVRNVRAEMFDEMRQAAQRQQELEQEEQRRQRQNQPEPQDYDADVESNGDSSSVSDSDQSASGYSSSEDGSTIWEGEVLLPPFAGIERLSGHFIHGMVIEGPLSGPQIAMIRTLFGELPARLWTAGRPFMIARTREGEYCSIVRRDYVRQRERQQHEQQQQWQPQQRRPASPVELETIERPVEVEAVRPVEMPAREQPMSLDQLLFIAREFGDDEAHRWYEGRGSRYARNRDGEVVLTQSALFEEFRL